MKAKLLTAIACVVALAGCQSGGETTAQNTNHQLLYIHENLVKCTGVAPMECMQVRRSSQEDWSYFYSNIEGFEYEPGYKYTLAVDVIDVPNPPADASSKRYILLNVLEKIKQP